MNVSVHIRRKTEVAQAMFAIRAIRAIRGTSPARTFAPLRLCARLFTHF